MTIGPNDTAAAVNRTPLWPEQLQDLVHRYSAAADEASRQRIRNRIWVLIHTALFTYLRSHSRRLGLADPEDLFDLASEKSLDLLGQISTGKWNLSEMEPLSVAAYVSKVARNDLIDWIKRKRSRQAAQAGFAEKMARKHAATPQEKLERMEFARALRECAESLSPRSRLIWILRVFAGLATKQIAGNPRIDLKPDHVDVLMQRARRHMCDCMEKKGFDTTIIPGGCFGEMLRSFDLTTSPLEPGEDNG